MRTFRNSSCGAFPLALALTLFLGSALLLGWNARVAAGERVFNAVLSGANEVPPVATQARGNAVLRLVDDGTVLHYKLVVANIENVMAAHVHIAPEGSNGPVALFLFGGPPTDGKTGGVLAEGDVTAGDLIGPLAGLSLSDLADEIQAGNAYVNVHTTAHPGGEIRGQVR